MFLEKISSPGMLRDMSPEELKILSGEIRQKIIDSVSKNGGHLASNLGAVELTIALHHVFDAVRTPIIFDVGHQCYTHKIITGRTEGFEQLRRSDGCSGFPNPEESAFDTTVCGHAGSAISSALGLSAARELSGNRDKVVAVVGDGALGNGISFEGLNGSANGGKNLLVILNDNRMSISPAVGAVSRRLSRIISGKFYNKAKDGLRSIVWKFPRVFRIANHIDDLLKSALLPPGVLFQELGVRYLGPVDGHDLNALIFMLRRVKELKGPVLLHVVTTKGKGVEYAEKSPVTYHGVGEFEAESGKMSAGSSGFSKVFGDWMCRKAADEPDLTAVSAAMIPGVGLEKFAELYPERCFDVGIAEEHAAIFAAGLALGGKKSVCALYATFAQRALDCIFHDVVLGKVPVVFVLDRAGAVPDGPTHHGIYDLGFLRTMPGLTVMSPRNGRELEMMLDMALDMQTPAVIRYPRGNSREKSLPEPVPLSMGRGEVLIEDGNDVIIWCSGAECGTGEAVAALLKEKNIGVTLVNARFLNPLDRDLAQALDGKVTVSIEDHSLKGGLGSALAEVLVGIDGRKLLMFGYPGEVIPHGGIDDIRRKYGLIPEDIAAAAAAAL